MYCLFSSLMRNTLRKFNFYYGRFTILYYIYDIHDTNFSLKKLGVITLPHKTYKSALICTALVPTLRGYR